MKDYKDTLNLPGTSFPMKANLPNREPEILKFWDEIDLYKEIRKKGEGKKPFLLLDGPPYANGKIHIGHALNKILKDFIVKSKTLFGYDAPYLPGWDCHGLPIEHQVEKKKGKVGPKLTAREFRDHCREYALRQVEEQKEDFIRLGVPGEWDNPYLTLDKRYEAEQIRAFAEIYANNHVTYGHKPVHWCLDCQSALAEAEVEYMDKVSTSVDVLFKIVDPSDFIKRANTKKIDDQTDIYIPIWTTTPWTLPSNEAVAMGGEISYGIYGLRIDERDILVIIANDLKQSIENRWRVENLEMLEEITAENFSGLQLQHPFDERSVPVLLGDHVTTENGTGSVHTAPAHGHEDFQLGKENDLDLNCYVNSYGVFTNAKESFANDHIFKSESNIIERLRESGLLISNEKFEHSYPHCWRHKTPVIFRTTRQWFISMENEDFRS
ncbi:MAG: class I tRNA ligase family protein, partial [Gammaproteobacteria bacterium]